ncbi:pyridoxamine 5'-phosphate oxidase family protein [Lentibacter algarum]|uniref:pyridoxamine 5'-phosphate oxidase family protein n=1 Tax=Lentibacter algarum TaxID=576131 RepID=UPI001C067543|nr:pyridoxamine 5'-phosphate oxidase family protein [Lentibacter algarum]MBU2980477.1 pyridoxamine 5'-phosphate oxidase family protein [Lentibacter algarum]
MTQIHRSHKGELLLQERRNTPKELRAAIPQAIDRHMPQQHAEFFAGLPYLPLATLDQRGRPWVSLLVTISDDNPSFGITVSGDNTTDVIAQANPFDPFARALQQAPISGGEKRLFAGVGIDFTNRRRNKIAGAISRAFVGAAGKIRLQLLSDQHLGNCPKYITVRSLAPTRRKAEVALDSFDSITSALPEAAKAVIDRASTVFLATKHIAKDDVASAQTDMGMNHRGGAPGFVRMYEETADDEVTTYLVLPDHSGNRFYQSLGNIETDPQVGLLFPDFATGDVLYVTGEAENLLDDDAEALMPRVSLVTRIKVTGAVLVNEGLDLTLTSEEQLSPYNPPVKLLRQELEQLGHAPLIHEKTAISATLVSTQTLSDTIMTFNFRLSSPIAAPLPGGFGVFDFSGLLDRGYSHMNEATPQLVNEDFVRTWTLSSAPQFDRNANEFRPTDHVSVTVKCKPGGLLSNVLHDNAHTLIANTLPVAFKGTGAGFTCFAKGPNGTAPTVPPKMLWIAGGVGITPFMSMWDGIVQIAKTNPDLVSTDIVLLFAGRDDDISVLNHFGSQQGSLPGHVKLRIAAFQSVSRSPSAARSAMDSLHEMVPSNILKLEKRRMGIEDIQSVTELNAREVFMCGPDGLMNGTETMLTELGVEQFRRHRETFIF